MTIQEQANNLLKRMLVLSEASVAHLEKSSGRTKAGTKEPKANGPVLHELWKQRFQDYWHDEQALERLVAAGWAAYELRRHGPPKIHDQVEAEDFILQHYEGVDAETVALIESERGALCRREYVIWLRKRNDRDERGNPVQASVGRLRLLERLRVEHPQWSQTRLAEELGVSRWTVSRLLEQWEAA